jgi:hypothetical protein
MASQKWKCRAWLWVLFAVILTTTWATNLNPPTIMEISKFDRQHSLLVGRSMTAGSSCSDEGQWYCMTSSFQRCASGQWSTVMQCAAGTQCSPSGQSYEFHVDFWNGGASSSSSSGTSTSAASRLSIAENGPILASTLVGTLLGGDWRILTWGIMIVCLLV